MFARFTNFVPKCSNSTTFKFFNTESYLKQCNDVVIIGGGAMGSSIAYWLKERCRDDLSIIVVEKDSTVPIRLQVSGNSVPIFQRYSKCSTVLSVGGLRQQFSLPENIQMSLYGAEFFKTLKERFGPEADVQFKPHGYLILASEDGAQQLMHNSNLQCSLGAVNQILSKNQLKQRFPWLNVTDVELGCLGLEKEGWFDPWALLTLLKTQALHLGAQFITGEVVDFKRNGDHPPNEMMIRLPDSSCQSIQFKKCVIAAGAQSGDVARLAKIGTGDGSLSVPLPVEPRKRYVYNFDCQGANSPDPNSPLMIDYTGAYFRKEGSAFIGGLSPSPEQEPDVNDLEVDYNYFDDSVWPLLAKRVPAFNSIKIKSAWSGFYEYNTFDENGIIGQHPKWKTFYFATGFSGHGIQQSPAVGRAIAELILDGRFSSIDLTRLGFDRFVENKPMYEVGIY